MTLDRDFVLWLVVLILLLGSALRMVALDQSPPGLLSDEACNSYDAYSIWHTGRDQHGILLPTSMRAFNDYRMPLFVYSQAPLVGMGGLTVTNARLAAAFWGILAIAATYWVSTLLFDRTVGLVAAFLLAISPWHVPFGRLAHEASTTVLVATLCVGLFWRWQREPQLRRLLVTAIVSGLGLYAYSVMKLFLPVMVATMAAIFWRKIIAHWRQVMVAALVGMLLSLPLAFATLRYPDRMQARYRQIAVFKSEKPLSEAAPEALGHAWDNLSPSFLFGRGDIDAVHHPSDGIGQLYPIQALLILIGLGWGVRQRKTRLPLAITTLWILVGVLPPALIAVRPGSGQSMRSLQTVVPWQLLSGLGMTGLLSLLKTGPIRVAVVLMTIAWVGANAVGHFGYYFNQYPSEAPDRLDVAMPEVIRTMEKLDDGYGTIYFTCNATYYAYINILFFTRYDPHLLQADLPDWGGENLFAPVRRVGKYHIICDTEDLWATGIPGLFVVPADELPDVPPLAVTTDADGQVLFKIVGRRFFPYDVSAIDWFSQCTQPAAPLSKRLVARGAQKDNLRQVGFNCISSWLYPKGAATVGAYALHHDLMSAPPQSSSEQPYPEDPFIARHLADARFVLNMSKFTKEFPAFVIYEQGHAPTLPAPIRLSALPSTAFPTTTTLPLTTPVSLDGPLIFLGAVAYPHNEGLEIETWWQVLEGPITRDFAIMAHLLTSDGEMLGVADGLGVFPLTLQAGDIAVQRHRFPKPLEEIQIWLRTGAYWRDTMERWLVNGTQGSDAIFIPLRVD